MPTEPLPAVAELKTGVNLQITCSVYLKLPVWGSLSLFLTLCSCLVFREKSSSSEAGWRDSVGIVAGGRVIRLEHTLIRLLHEIKSAL